MKIAIIGIGTIAEFQLQALANLNDVTLVGGYDIQPERAKLLPATAVFYPSLDALLAECEADLFLLSTPSLSHYPLGKRVLKQGHSLLLEKPCCQTETQLADLLCTARKHNQFFSVALHAAYGREVDWYLSQIQAGKINYGPLTGFYSAFFDSYYQAGELKPSAQSLGGAWFDSGINALSVIGNFIDPSQLQLIEGHMTRIASLACSEIQGIATFTFSQNEAFGHGIIETNWALGIDRKVTQLFYATTNTRVTLNHSDQTVLVHRNGSLILEKNLQNQLPRLTNHYINLFQDMSQRFRENNSNLDYAAVIHGLLFTAGHFTTGHFTTGQG